MRKLLFFSVLVLLLFYNKVCFSQTQNSRMGIGGAIEDSFKKDYRRYSEPKDKNADIITEKELIKNLPKETSQNTVFVSSFDITGNRVMDKRELELLLDKYLARNLTLEQINDAADIITKYYRSKGYIISYAYIPPQVINNSIVNIAVVEGEIGEVIIEGLSDYKQDFIIKALEPLQQGFILDTKVLERSLLILNSYLNLKVNATLKPGKKKGSTDIIIYAEDTNPYRASFSVDNFGNKLTNQYRLNGAAVVGNIIKSGDRLALNLSLGLDQFNPWQLFFGRIDYRIPIGSDGFKLGFAYGRSNYIVTKTFDMLGLNGYSNDYSIYAEYPLVLRNFATLYLGAGIFVKDAADEWKIKDYGTKITDHDVLVTAGLSLFGDAHPWTGANMFYSLAFTQGLNGFLGASHFSASSTNRNASGYYEKLYLDYEYHQLITWFFRMRMLFSAQVVSGTTFSSERFYTGGIYSVRGFDSGLESGDNGYRLSLEAEFDVAIPQIKALVFYDRGQVFNYNEDFHTYKDASLDSVGAGLHFYPWGGLALKIDYGYPLMSSRPHKTGWGTIYGRVSYDF